MVKPIGDRLREVRRARKLSQKDMAELIDVSPRFYQSMEANKHSPAFKIIEKALKKLKMTFGEFFEENAQVVQPVAKEPNWAECARVLEALHTSSEPRRLCALYLLLDDEKYLAQLEAFEDFRPIVAVLKIAL